MSAIEKQQSIDSTKTVNVLYFASLADEANCSEEKVIVPKSMSLNELYAQLDQKYNFSREQSELKVAINDYFAKWSDNIDDGDSVVFITPVAGG